MSSLKPQNGDNIRPFEKVTHGSVGRLSGGSLGIWSDWLCDQAI
jgi:hypothetical protein